MTKTKVSCIPKGKKLRRYQKEGIKRIVTQQRTLLSDEMGLGKSCQALVASNLWKNSAVLIVCPACLIINWKREIKMWDTLDRRVFCVDGKDSIANYAYEQFVIISDASLHLLSLVPKKFPKDEKKVSLSLLKLLLLNTSPKSPALLICDEFHRMSNWDAQRTNVIHSLLPLFHLFIGITGTPLMNRISNLHSLVSACAPDLFPGFKTFCETYATPVFDGYAVEYRGARNITKLKKKLSRFMIRRYKADVLKQLPKKIYVEHLVEIDRKLAERSLAYVSYAKQLIAGGKTANSVDILDDEAENLASIRKELGIAKIPHIVEYCDTLMQGGSKPLVVFCHHRKVVEDVTADLDARGYKAELYYGGLNNKVKDARVHDFQNGYIDILVCSITAAGLGLTLTASNTAVFGELDYVPANMSQCADRIHRIGQDRGVMIHNVLAQNSLDDKISQTLWDKTRIINKVVGRDTDKGKAA